MNENAATDATTPVTKRDDGGFTRTALNVTGSGTDGSVDILYKGEFLARINIFASEDWLGVDIIDVAEQYQNRHALVFMNGQKSSLVAGKVVAADFRRQ